MARRTAPIAAIKVPAGFTLDGAYRNEVATFRLGLGPCGLTVRRLRARLDPQAIVIRQDHVDGPPKTFVYPLNQLTGRVEIEHLEVTA